MKVGSIVIVIFAALVALPLSAKEKVTPAVNADTKDTFEAVSSWVRKQMAADGRYAHVTADERSKVNADLDAMGKLFDARGAVTQMSPEEKMTLLNRQEEVNATLAKRDRERLICSNERPVGSNLPVRTCRTAGEIEGRSRDDKRYLEQRQAAPQKIGGG